MSMLSPPPPAGNDDATAAVAAVASPPVARSRDRKTLALTRLLGAFLPADVMANWKWDVAAGLCSGVYQGAVWTFALQLARGAIHANGFQMGLATAAPAFGYLFSILWARQMEGKSKLPFVTVTWTISRGLFIFTPFLVRGSVTQSAFIALICITPIMFSVSTPAYTSIMKEVYPDHLRGRLMSYVRVAMSISMLLTARLMGYLQEYRGLDFRWMFLIGGIFGVGTAVAFSRLQLPPAENSESPPMREFLIETLRIPVVNVGYRWFVVSVFLTGFGNLLQTPAQYVVHVDLFHIRPTQISTMQNLAGITSMASLFFWGWYMDRFGSLSTVLVAVSINAMAPLVYAFAPTLGWLYWASVAMGVSQSGIDLGYLNTTLMFAEKGRVAQYQAVHSTLFGLRGTIAPMFTFELLSAFHHNWSRFFLFCAALMGVGTAFQCFSLRTYRQIQAKLKAELRPTVRET